MIRVRSVSGELYRALWKRAHVYLREARRLLEEAEYDIALAMAGQSAQLALKAAYTRLLGDAPRGHSLRRLLGYLATVLEGAGHGREADMLWDFDAWHR